MSMNVRFGTGSCHCDAIRQTPTNETKLIVGDANPKFAYLAWLKEQMDGWAKDDPDGSEEGYRHWNQQLRYETERIEAYEKDHPNAEWEMD